MGYIYKITNLQNNKLYIGKTITCIQKRWQKHIYEATTKCKGYNFLLHKAIRKYGIKNFIIEEVENIDDNLLNEREMYWIQYFNSIAPNGYNMTLGGEGSIKIDRKQVYSYWDSGLSIPQISKIMHCSIDGVKNILLSYNNFSKEENNKRVI